MTNFLSDPRLQQLSDEVAELRRQLASVASQTQGRGLQYGGPYRTQVSNFGWIQGPTVVTLDDANSGEGTIRLIVPDWILRLVRCNMLVTVFEGPLDIQVTTGNANGTVTYGPGPNTNLSDNASPGTSDAAGTGDTGTPSATQAVAGDGHKHLILDYVTTEAAGGSTRRYNFLDQSGFSSQLWANASAADGMVTRTPDTSDKTVASSGHTHTGPSHTHPHTTQHQHGLASHHHDIDITSHYHAGIVGPTAFGNQITTLEIDGVDRLVELYGGNITTPEEDNTFDLLPYFTTGPQSIIGPGQGRVETGIHTIRFVGDGKVVVNFDWYVVGKAL